MRLMFLAPCILSLAGFAACTGPAPYPNGSPFQGGTISPNRYTPGSPRFCREYARQTAANSYENRVDRGEDGFGARVLKQQFSARAGDRAYRRCMAGRR
ncbi:hypothetical protein LQ948_04265 [Jiella sp. MQZ9-1]|uniref:Uncharacterized protein n=1 Tax=Jiella flava TaxID=2816857 RepID=A0A939FTQ6_9HYPH|nr:hypothetical protein [Jiella flava]MBO0661778.1 hypothetical protein [Jiella flava]MCD2470419.1 hypothetical protein [Jiella flava]